jgi:hypothetical protein
MIEISKKPIQAGFHSVDSGYGFSAVLVGSYKLDDVVVGNVTDRELLSLDKRTEVRQVPPVIANGQRRLAIGL